MQGEINAPVIPDKISPCPEHLLEPPGLTVCFSIVPFVTISTKFLTRTMHYNFYDTYMMSLAAYSTFTT